MIFQYSFQYPIRLHTVKSQLIYRKRYISCVHKLLHEMLLHGLHVSTNKGVIIRLVQQRI
jgi:hypothetical protein